MEKFIASELNQIAFGSIAYKTTMDSVQECGDELIESAMQDMVRDVATQEIENERQLENDTAEIGG